MHTIDLNADIGEGGSCDEELLRIVSSCNIACGGHAGDSTSMKATIRSALANGVCIGAHPSYPDREGFGRRSRFSTGEALHSSLLEQLEAINDIAGELETTILHVKPHGALYNDAADSMELAALIVCAVSELPGPPALVGLPDSCLQQAAKTRGLRFVAEAFIDRMYGVDGRLIPRTSPGAVLIDSHTMTRQALSLAMDSEVMAFGGESIGVDAETLCIHGDTLQAAEVAATVRLALEQKGVSIRAICR